MKIMPDKIASGVSYCTSGALVCGGGVAQWIHNVDWNMVAIITGIVIGIATYITNLYYKNRQTKAYEAALAAGNIKMPPQDN